MANIQQGQNLTGTITGEAPPNGKGAENQGEIQ